MHGQSVEMGSARLFPRIPGPESKVMVSPVEGCTKMIFGTEESEITDDGILSRTDQMHDCSSSLDDIIGQVTKSRLPIQSISLCGLQTSWQAIPDRPRATGSYEGLVYICRARNRVCSLGLLTGGRSGYLCFPNNPTGAVASRAGLT